MTLSLLSFPPVIKTSCPLGNTTQAAFFLGVGMWVIALHMFELGSSSNTRLLIRDVLDGILAPSSAL